MSYIGTQFIGSLLSTAGIADDAVTEAKVANDAIGITEIKAASDGQIISYDANADPVLIAAGTSGHFLKSQGDASQPVFAAAGGLVLQNVTMAIAEATGTSGIPMDDTLPTSGEGTSIGSQAIVCATTASKVLITGSILGGNSDDAQHLVIAIFRGTTCIGLRGATSAGTDSGYCISFSIIDAPSTAGSVTYSARAGRKAAGTWFVGAFRADGAYQDFGDASEDGVTLTEMSA
jgi:hypothetical protein